jgi:MinD superfamily P-loop ATPase
MDMGRGKVSFEEADLVLARTKESAILEARRCLGCGPCTECLGAEGLCDADKALVDETKCTGCGVCVVVCPYGAVTKNDEGVAHVDEDICKGCGICCASCPERAISMKKFTEAQIMTDVAKALKRRTS